MAGDGGSVTEAGSLYSPLVGLIYVFNLIVGTGALTMPKAFAEAGWLISLVLVVLLGFVSFVTATFVIEAMAAANGLLRWKKEQEGETTVEGCDNHQEDVRLSDERRPLLRTSNEMKGPDYVPANMYYEIKERVEMGKMTSLFFNKLGVYLFYLCIVIYLYGDLAIYAVTIPKSLRDVVCTFGNNYTLMNETISDDDKCWEGKSIKRLDIYRIFVAVFLCLLGPFTFFNVQKTKMLQISTTILRWLAFGLMIVLATIQLTHGVTSGVHPAVANFSGIPNLFGVCVYSFMCHHSLPSLVTPIANKSKIYTLFAIDYLLILGFYALLSFTGIFAFSDLRDLYTLNFEASATQGLFRQILGDFLALFPVFTLSANLPIISITLRNNLKTLFYREKAPFGFFVDKIIFPLVTILPPFILALITNDVTFLVGITGSYAGAAIQYIIPACLVFFSRRLTSETVGNSIANAHTSPFRHKAWVFLVLLWALVCIVFVTVNHIITGR